MSHDAGMSDGAGTSDDQLEVRDLVVRYGSVEAVRGVSLHVPPKSLVALLGANGAGKSTLLGAIAGLQRPRSGTVYLAGQPIHGLPAQRIARRGLRMVPETRAVFTDMSVQENLEVGAGRVSAGVRQTRFERVFELFPRLAERRAQTSGSLSGGEQQMLSIARALVAEPSVLLLDEPSMGLAPRVVADIVATIGQLRDEGLTVLVAEQNARSVLPVADLAVVMRRGTVAYEGTSAEVGGRLDEEGYLG